MGLETYQKNMYSSKQNVQFTDSSSCKIMSCTNSVRYRIAYPLTLIRFKPRFSAVLRPQQCESGRTLSIKTAQTTATCRCMAAGQSPRVRAWLRPRLNAGPVCDAQCRWGVGLQRYVS